MDIEYYRNFITIVETGSISAAAKRINIAQPALSNQLKILQKYYGATLINVQRGGHSLDLTEAGVLLFNKAKYICSMERDALREVANSAAGFTGTLRIDLSPSMSISFIKNYLAGFSKAYPDINYELYESTIELQTKHLLDGDTEIGVANAPLLQPYRFEAVLNRKERLYAVFNRESPYLENNSPNILLEDLEEMPLCLSRGCSTLFLGTCSDSNIYPQVLSITTTKLAAMAWAEKNCGVAIVPIGIGEKVGDNLLVKTIQDERLYYEQTLSVVKGRQLSKAAKLLLQYITENAVSI